MRPQGTIPHVLIVDDDPDFVRLLRRLLESVGFRVCSAESGERALEMLPGAGVDLVLLDICMPGMDGFETCRRIKADPAINEIPIVFITAEERSEAMLAGALNAGAADYFTKPLSRADVLPRVRNVIVQRIESFWLRRADADDSVTGLPGRAYFRSRIEEELAECARYHTPVCLILTELDGLDRLYAERGKEAGNRWVARFAMLLRSEVRRHDVVARLAESRFGLLLPRVSAAGAQNASARLSRTWELAVASADPRVPYTAAVFASEVYDGHAPTPSSGDLLRQTADALDLARQTVPQPA